MSNHDFNKYKKAKIIVSELETLLKIIDLSIKGITPFKKYNSISETLMCLNDNKTILDIHLNHYKKVIETKGSVDETQS